MNLCEKTEGSPAEVISPGVGPNSEWRADHYVAVFGLFALLGFIIISSTVHLKFDEPWYLSSVELVEKCGLSNEFLRQLPGPAGPLYAVIHYLASPLTHTQVPGVRFVNPVLLLGTLMSLFGCFRILKPNTMWAAIAAFVASPTIWVCTGLVLTEIPAVFFLSLALFLLLLSLHTKGLTRASLYALTGGLALSAAILGRQPAIVFLAAVPIFAFQYRRHWLPLLLFVAASLALPVYVFWVWRGLTPPLTAYVASGISLQNGLFSFMYAAATMIIWAPRWFPVKVHWAVIFVAAAMVLNMLFPIGQHIAIDGIAKHILSPYGVILYGRAAYGILASIGLLFIYALLVNVWRNRRDLTFVSLAASIFVLLCTSMKVTHLFSSRYIATALPLLFILSDRYTVSGRWRALRLLGGLAVGAMSLYSFYRWTGALYFHHP